MAVQGELFAGPPDRAPLGAVDQWAAGQTRDAVVGLDEAGRGPLAGPVVAAAVCLPPLLAAHPSLAELHDSKRLTEAARDRVFSALVALRPAFGIGRASAAEVDAVNILEATRLAMHRALGQCRRRLGNAPIGLVLVDGNLPLPGLVAPQRPLVKGDARAWCIAAASVLAKVVRDRHLDALDGRYPGYGLGRHKGYGTRAHRAALARLGPCPEHRRTFRSAPLAEGSA